MPINNMKKQILTYILLLLGSALFVTLFSTSTSPLYLQPSYGDSEVYKTIAYSWLNGKIPYKDLFDHKGPLIFFIDAVGLKLTGNTLGIFAIQILNLFVTSILCWKLIRKELSKSLSAIIMILAYAILASAYQEGNNVEEYCLPFLLASYYYAYIWLKKYDETEGTTIKPRIPIIFGLTFGVCAMTRITNALGICIVALGVMYILIKQKEWRELRKCTYMFIAGASIIITPFCIYFYAVGAWNDFIFCALKFNIEYALLPKFGWRNSVFLQPITYSQTFLLIIITLYAIIKGNSRKYLNTIFLIVGLFTLLLFIKGRRYNHYVMVAFPFIPIFADLFKTNIRGIINSKTITAIKCALIICTAIIVGTYLYHVPTWRISSSKIIEKTYEDKLLSYIPSKDRKKVLFVNCDLCSTYNSFKIIPECRFFVLQDFQAQFSKEYHKMRNEAFKKCTVKYIIYADFSKHIGSTINTNLINPSELREIIEQHYICIKKQGDYRIYKIKSSKEKC